MKKKLEWKKPVISRVGLDPEQAVLDVCHTGHEAAWIDLTAAVFFCTGGDQDNQGVPCGYDPRGLMVNTTQEGNQSPGS